MVTSPSGESVILIGGFIATNRTHSNILLEWKGKSKKWIQLNQTLTFYKLTVVRNWRNFGQNFVVCD